MKKTLLIGAMALFACSTATVQAGPMNPKGPAVAPPIIPAPQPMFTYDFLDIQYIYTDFDSPWLDNGHGAGANISKSLGGPIYATGSFSWTDTDSDYEPVDLYGASAGLGAYYPIMDRLHVNVEGGAVWSKDDYGHYSEDDWGYYVGPGVRFAVCPGFELFTNVYYFDFGGQGDTDGIDVNFGVVFDINPYLGLKVGGLVGEDQNSAFVGARIYY